MLLLSLMVAALNVAVPPTVHGLRAPVTSLNVARAANEQKAARFQARTAHLTAAAHVAAVAAKPTLRKRDRVRNVLGSALRKVGLRRASPTALGGSGGAHRMAGRWPPPPRPALAKIPDLKSWYDEGTRLTPPPPKPPAPPPVKSWYDAGIRLRSTAPPPSLPQPQPAPTPTAHLPAPAVVVPADNPLAAGAFLLLLASAIGLVASFSPPPS